MEPPESTAPRNFSKTSNRTVASELPGSPTIEISDLLDNEFAQKLRSSKGNAGRDFHHATGLSVHIDWGEQENKLRLRSVCKLTRHLWQVEDFLSKEAFVQKTSSISQKKTMQKMLEHKWFTKISLLFTVYALLVPDFSLLSGQSAQSNLVLAIITTGVFMFFLVEAALTWKSYADYPCSSRFWIDVLACLSMVGDTWVGYEVLSSDSAVAGRGTKVLRIMRMSGRSSRFVRLLRSARLAQVLRIVPRLWQHTNSTQQRLAVVLYQQRLWRLFQYLDVDCKGFLSPIEAEFLDMAFAIEFAEPDSNDDLRRSWSSGILKRVSTIGSVRRMSTRMLDSISALRRGRSTLKRFKYDELTFNVIAEELSRRPEGKQALKACREYVRTVEDSSTLLHQTTGRLALKVAILVLVMVGGVPLLDVPRNDVSQLQGLVQVDLEIANPNMNDHDRCVLVRHYAQESKAALLFLALNWTQYWGANCDCCRDPIHKVAGGTMLDIAKTFMDNSDVQPHELALHCHPDDEECGVESRSGALFDIHVAVRDIALRSLIYTFTVLVLMISFILFFTSDVQVFNRRVLSPLWDLMDDMAAIKAVEVVLADTDGNFNPAMSQGLHRFVEEAYKSSLSWCCGYCKSVFRGLLGDDRRERDTDEQRPEHMQEVTSLRNSFLHLHGALRSWAKFVPVPLIKQLYTGNVEAKLGVHFAHAAILFFDIGNMDALCEGMKPEGVLDLLYVVHSQVSRAVDNHMGTLLEFIGDEVLIVFNLPQPSEDYRAAAIHTAVEILERTKTLPLPASASVHARVGVHCARILAGNIGSPTRMKYGMLGDGVNTTARLKSLNSQYRTECLVSEDVLSSEELHASYLLRPIGNLILKGRTKALKTWELMGRKASSRRQVFQAVDTHGLAFKAFLAHDFSEAASLFRNAHALLSQEEHGVDDFPSEHMAHLCDQCILVPPPPDWDGAERLSKK